MTLVQIKGLSIGYARNRTVTPAVTGLDLTVGESEVVAIVGESGSGKTTTANAIIGLLPPNGRITAGSMLVDGVSVAGAPERVLRRLRGSTVGLIPQDPMVGLNPTQRVGAQVAEAIRLRRGTESAAGYLEQAGVPPTWARHYPHQLSGGLRQRVLIAIALAGKPKLIIADEPTSALDVTVQKRILDHLGGLVRDQDISLLIITHDLAVAAERADRVVVMKDGRKVEEGLSADALRDPYSQRLIAAAPRLPRDVPAPPASTGDPVLVLTDVTKTFGSFTAVEKVSLTVPRGRTHAVVGESGCGKTTTLRMALGLETVTSGSVLLAGTEITGLSWNRMRPLRRRAQLVHQDPFATLDPKFTIEQSITEPLVSFRIGDRRTRRARALELLDQVALPAAFLNRLPKELSGGQRQRVAIARALALEPDLLMLDEPVSALDVLVQEQILQLLTDLQKNLNLSYLLVSHDLSVVAEISHTVSVMNAGRVVEEGPVATVFTTPSSDHTRELLDAIPGARAESTH